MLCCWSAKKKALALVKSSNPPLTENGHKKGYMSVMKELSEVKSSCSRRKTHSNKNKRVFEEKAAETQKRIFITKAELERIKQNRKVTKRGKENCALLMEECKKISSFDPFNYMVKKKAQLRKLKARYIQDRNRARPGR